MPPHEREDQLDLIRQSLHRMAQSRQSPRQRRRGSARQKTQSFSFNVRAHVSRHLSWDMCVFSSQAAMQFSIDEPVAPSRALPPLVSGATAPARTRLRPAELPIGTSVLAWGVAPEISGAVSVRLAETPAFESVVPGISVSVAGLVRAESLRSGVTSPCVEVPGAVAGDEGRSGAPGESVPPAPPPELVLDGLPLVPAAELAPPAPAPPVPPDDSATE